MVKSIVMVVSFLDLLSTGLCIFLMGPHSLSLGCSYMALGIFDSFTAVLQLLSATIFGSLSDVKGTKNVLLIMSALSFLNTLLLGYSSSLTFVFLYRILYGLTNHVQIILKITVAENVTSEQQSVIYSQMQALIGFAFMIGSILGGQLYELSGGFHYIAPVLSVLLLVNTGLVFLLPKGKPNVKYTSGTDTKESNFFYKIRREIVKPYINLKSMNWNAVSDIFSLKILFDFAFIIFVTSSGIILRKRFGFSQKEVGYIIGIHTLLSIVSNLLMIYIKKILYRSDVTGYCRINHGFIGASFSLLGLALSRNYWLYVMCLVPFTFACTILQGIWIEILLSRIDEKQKGILMGSLESSVFLTRIGMPLLTGICGQLWGHNAVAFLSFIPALAGVIFVNKYKIKSHKQ